MADGAKIGEDNELMLELSIGGIFGKPTKPNRNSIESTLKENRIGVRRKREEKLKKPAEYSGSCGSVSGPFLENKEWLEGQVVQPACKKEKIGSMPEKVGLGLTAEIDDDVNHGFRLTACRSFRPYEGNVIDGGGGGRCCCKVNLNGCATSAYSDGQCSSHQDDSRSNSSNSQLDQQPATTSTASVEPCGPSDQPTGSSKETVTPNDRSNPHEPSLLNPPSKPENQHQHQQASLLARMPCVSTTGNGPNGKTVSGFLYTYTKHEVSIVCVCHGRSFSPAGFVEHAGGVDIAHPLKHITIFPAAFAS